MKRAMDIIIASLALMIASPLLVLLSVVVWIDVGRPVFFRQLRPGLHGRPFEILKFRTMRDVADGGVSLPDEQRITRIGRFLRSTSLDELPELWNVLKGEMSLVGPRPLLMEYLPLYNAEQRRRHEVRPGLTGWAQINGRNALTWEQKFKLDLWYVENRSISLDTVIILRSLAAVLFRRGISHHGHATMPLFEGSPREAGKE